MGMNRLRSSERTAAPRPAWEYLYARYVLTFLVLTTLGVAVLAITWKFHFEEHIDPFLPGHHAVDSLAERWEFVIAACLFSLLSMLLPAAVVYRLFGERAASARRSAAVFDTAPQPMLLVDRQRRVIEANSAFERLSGLHGDALRSKPLEQLPLERDVLEIFARLNDRQFSAGSASGEVRGRRPDGSVYVVWLSVTVTQGPAADAEEYIVVLTDITARKHREERTLRLAMHDPLTDLANRRLFMQRLDQVLAAARVGGETVALLFIDLDGFKPINDQHGHAVGDQVLQGVAERLRSVARSVDLVARLGGDEFVLLARDLDSDQAAQAIVHRCRQTLEQPLQVDGIELPIRASIGVALSHHGGDTAEALLKAADLAMYEVKRARYEARKD